MRHIAVMTASLFGLAWFSAFGAVAIELSDIGVADAGADIVLGEWHGGFDKCLEKANKEHIPMFAIWSNTGCSHCESVYTALVTDRFVNWRRGEGSSIGKIILLMMKGGVSGNGYSTSSEGYDWAWGPGHKLTLYPFTVMYWNKEDGTVIREHNVGEALTEYSGGEEGAESLIRRLEQRFAGWNGVVTTPTEGVTFAVGGTTSSRLEAEVGYTTWVDIPLIRTNGVTAVGTNYLTVSFSDAILKESEPVPWNEGALTTMARLNLNTLEFEGNAGDVLTLTLADDTVTNVVATSTITYVSPRENSLEYPLWIGERTVDTLAPGEWTMDFDAATNRTARQRGAAYTLVAAVGSLWCPDCKRLTTNLTDKAVFKNWAVDNNVSLVQIDAPYGTYEGPTLLSYSELWSRSGAGYLSRKMADADVAASVLERNKFLYKEVWNNLYTDGRARIKLPTLLMLDKSARVVARIDDDSLSFNPDYMISRLNEMILASEESGEELNAQWFTTEETISPGTKNAAVSALDKADYYKISAGSERVHVTLAPSDKDKPGKGWLRLVNANGEMLANSPFSPDETVSVSGAVPTEGAYVYVGADLTTGSPQCFTTSGTTTVFPYTLTLRTVNILTATAVDYPVDSDMAKNGFLVRIDRGAAYRLEGIDELDDELAKVVRRSEATGPGGETLYQGIATADVFLPVAAGASVVTASVWESGAIGFSGALMRSVVESSGGALVVEFAVSREGGSSGDASVEVAVSSNSTCLPFRYYFPETICSWANGEEGEKIVSFTLFNDSIFDTDQQLIFEIKAFGNGVVTIPIQTSVIVFTIVDDDSPEKGRLAITGSTPGFSSKNTVIATENSPLTVNVSREDGTTDNVTATLVMMNAKGEQIAESAVLAWPHRSAETLSATFTLPAYLETRRAYVKLVSGGNIDVDYERNMVTVEILPTSVPTFSQDMLSATIYKNVSWSENIAIEGLSSIEGVEVAKTTGTLPPGMTAALQMSSCDCGPGGSAPVLAISGVPTRIGTYTATYRVSQSANGNILRGGTLTVRFDVLSIPATEEEAEQQSVGGVVAVPNPAVAKARTFRNLPVIVETDSSDDLGATGRLAGYLTLTIPASGRASAKYSGAGSTGAVFSSSGWMQYNPNTGELTLDMEDPGDYRNESLVVTIYPDGTGQAILINVAELGGGIMEKATVELVDPGWSASNTAEAWSGRYNVQLPQNGMVCNESIPEGTWISTGDAVLSLKMTGTSALNRGRMTYAGYLPDGRSVSGMSIVLPYGTSSVALPVLSGNDASAIAGVLEIKPYAVETHRDNGGKNNHFVYPAVDAYPYWITLPAAEDVSCVLYSSVMSSLDVFGGYYDGDETLLYDCCLTSYGDTNLTFSVALGGAPIDFVPVTATIGEHSLTITSSAEDNPNRVRLAFSRDTGIFSGSFRAFVDEIPRVFSFRGVLMPGWGGCEKCGPITLPRPIGSGTCWYSDITGYKHGFALDINKDDEEE